MAVPALTIHLLGAPAVERHGVPAAPPRGRKAWALLAYLLTTESAHTRQWLAELLFEEADDPLNALSWNLSELRRLLGVGLSPGGEMVRLELPPSTFVDIRALTTGAARWRTSRSSGPAFGDLGDRGAAPLAIGRRMVDRSRPEEEPGQSSPEPPRVAVWIQGEQV